MAQVPITRSVQVLAIFASGCTRKVTLVPETESAPVPDEVSETKHPLEEEILEESNLERVPVSALEYVSVIPVLDVKLAPEKVGRIMLSNVITEPEEVIPEEYSPLALKVLMIAEYIPVPLEINGCPLLSVVRVSGSQIPVEVPVRAF